ncbi:TPA: hypothetical protein ACN73J_005814, partial [Klebsiella pneumoniae]
AKGDDKFITTDYLRSLWPGMRKRRWATALLPSKAINKNGMSFPIPFPLLQTVGDDFSRRR